jgi:hypothetical protein
VDFTATELLGRPTDGSVTVNMFADEDLEVYFEYGTESGVYTGQTDTTVFTGGEPIEVVIHGLQPNTRYYYRMVYRQTGETEWMEREEHSFHTQRAKGDTFTFTLQADSHAHWAIVGISYSTELYERTLLNVLSDNPDFHIDLGDAFQMDNVTDVETARSRYLEQRPFFGLVSHSSPIFLVIGNWENEEGWHRDGTADNEAIYSTNARKRHYLNPIPGDFYSGSESVWDWVDGDGLRENYYAWEWGNALFVVLDPFWHTVSLPHNTSVGGEPGSGGSGDNWDWTLGEEQYIWFKQTLEQSNATFKFVLSHQVTGGTTLYGRGGIEASPYYEWGGRNSDSTWGFDTHRPGWETPIHQLMVENGVTIFFHGHDHVFVKQEIDGVVYQECPQPVDASYGYGHYAAGGYESGDALTNSGHLRVMVSLTEVTVDYVRAYLPGDGTNGEVAYSYTIHVDCTEDSDCDDSLYCNGVETCDGGTCQGGNDPCPGQFCDEESDTCVDCLVDGDCDDGVYCNGTETCMDHLCQAGTLVDCGDGIECTKDSCNETADSCENVPDDGECDDGLFCNGAETCDAQLGCQTGSDPCPGQFCIEESDTCVDCLVDGDCDDSLYCNGVETCDGGTCQGGNNPCPGQFCDEESDTCVDCLVDGDCDDGVYCNGTETCMDHLCQAGTLIDCGDGIECTKDSCNETADSCENVPDDGECDDSLFCNGVETCDAQLGCQAGSEPCPGQFCVEESDTCVDCLVDGDCDDSLYCNGVETCGGGTCQGGNDPCPDQFCDEEGDSCIDCMAYGDNDEDGVGDLCDNCPDDYNPDQVDDDGDGYGTACDCDDDDPNDYPGSQELCDGEDNDCDGFYDEDFQGDTDCDGDIDSDDALCALWAYVLGQVCSDECECECCLLASDVSCDSRVTPDDALAILWTHVDSAGHPLNPCPVGAPLFWFAAEEYNNLTVSLDSVEGSAGNTVRMPVVINDPSGIDAFGLEITFPEDLLSFVEVAKTWLTQEWFALVGVERESGLITIGGLNTEGLTWNSSEAIANIVFEVRTVAQGEGNLNITEAVDDLSRSQLINGHFKVTQSSVAEIENITPYDFWLGQNYPNPFNPETRLDFRLPHYKGQERLKVTLRVYDIRGRMIRTLVDEKKPGGTYQVIWDGKDENGNEVASGVYFYKLEADDFTQAKKMVLIK